MSSLQGHGTGRIENVKSSKTLSVPGNNIKNHKCVFNITNSQESETPATFPLLQ